MSAEFLKVVWVLSVSQLSNQQCALNRCLYEKLAVDQNEQNIDVNGLLLSVCST